MKKKILTIEDKRRLVLLNKLLNIFHKWEMGKLGSESSLINMYREILKMRAK